ncbi:armadillo-type protein [Halteromyces radiatus]|uniref:armadillo-type protein n=1 Tax=Halteromyces radiatus TaxID=101107 RepID=UPI00221EFBB3|nr:armadillo-type protein [Halteromyces radiatus]KAI8096223.1 armadillo-type protein [Halteromyces radiatus]
MLATSSSTTHLDPTNNHQRYQQRHPFYYQQQKKIASSSSISTPSTYNLFNSLPLFTTKNITSDWDIHHHHNKDDLVVPTNQGLITDFGSSSTHSPKEEFYDDYYLKPRDILDTDTMKYQLKDAMEIIQSLNQKVHLLTEDLQQKQHTINSLQSTITIKDLEIQEQSRRLAKLINDNAELKYKQKILTQEFDTIPNRITNTVLVEKGVSEQTNKWQRWNDDKPEYKRHMEKNSNTDWDTLVNRILKSTDQQASIYLQQRLKTCTLDQKQDIFKAVHREAYALMTNRFGNFLVQRLFELGTPEQIHALAQSMVGHVITLTCEPFGCHVVQKALDSVDENMKAKLVTELFERIPDTIVHKSACHVWQKVFEIRWTHHHMPVMNVVYQALKNKWHQVAMDETGSLVIQNIFENLPESDKRPVLDEILANMFTIARGQWGNWVIQHILEQAEDSEDREKAFNMVLERGIQLSMDQFASKVVEKALSIGGPDYMAKFIHHISTESRSHRPRIALIDIASDQYGNYVVQWIINNAKENHKLDVCRLIKRHMVSLRGSKYGQRVAFLVDKALKHYEITTYPIRE